MMVEEGISIISNFFWKKSIDNINQILSEGQIKNFNMNDYYYLTVIHQLGTPNFGDVSEKLKLTKPSISALVQRLIKNELVTKIQSEEDRRVFYIKLTSKAQKIIQGDYILYQNLADSISEYLTDKQKADMECLLNTIVANIKKNYDEEK